ncbi:MAG: type III polyketide synthase [Planctomycetaceae bacterium]
MSLAILGIGTAAPERQILQGDAAEFAVAFTDATPVHARLLAKVYEQTRVRSRGSVLLDDPGTGRCVQTFFPPAADTEPGGPGTRARMDRYAAEAGPLAIAAASRAVAAAGVDGAAITHLVTCSCTGFATPGFDFDLVAALGLPATVARTHVGFMGCHGAFNALRVAEAFVEARPESVPLVVCVELCSLHFQYGWGRDVVVANAIFADGAAAVVGGHPSRPRHGAGPAWRIDLQWSAILPESRGQMGWTIGDHGFEMHLAAAVPAAIGRHLPAALAAGLGAAGLSAADVTTWAVHPGGPRVLVAVAESLGLSSAALAASHEVLAEHGNMSSATILFILERLLRSDAAGPCVAMAFGPGLTAELALLSRA